MISKFYEVSGDAIKTKKQTCPRCGAGVFLAEHDDRLSCGKCGYSEFKSQKPEVVPNAQKE